MSGPLLTVENVQVWAASRAILDVERFSVATGESVALVGPNGAGKTTLLHVAALLQRPDAGTVTMHGQTACPENAAALRRSLSVVFQTPLLFDVPVLANAAAGLRFQGRPRAEAERHARAWLERFGVGHLAAKRARHLSAGEASRVALARAFATDPALLLLDEPFSALDAPTRATLLPALRSRLRETGTAAVLVTHDLDEAIAFSDRIALMEGGRIVASGSAPDLIARPPSRRVAELLRIETILPARVTQVETGSALVTIEPAGPAICVARSPGAGIRPGAPVTVALPASAVRALCPGERAPAGWNALPATVATVTPLRSSVSLVLATPAPLTAHAPWDPACPGWRAGDRAIVAFPREAAHLISGNDAP